MRAAPATRYSQADTSCPDLGKKCEVGVWSGFLAGDFLDEVKIADVHALAEVEAMGARPVGAGVEVQFGAASLPGEVAYPGEEAVAVALGAAGLVGDQVVEVKHRSAPQVFLKPVSGQRTDLPGVFQRRQPVTPGVLPAHALRERDGGQVRAELHHHRKGGGEVGVGLDVEETEWVIGGGRHGQRLG